MTHAENARKVLRDLPGHSSLAELYIKEAESQDGENYWNNFLSATTGEIDAAELVGDFLLYIEFMPATKSIGVVQNQTLH